jgi:hypothetical protein
MGMLDSWLASVMPGYGGVTSMAGATPAAAGAPAPSGMLASLFSPSGYTQSGGTMDAILSGAVPATVQPGQFPPTAGSAFASAPPGPPLDLSPPAAPQGSVAAPQPSAPAQPPAVPQTSLLGRLGALFGDKAGSVLGGIGDSLGAHQNTLMALGSGLAGAPTLGMGLSRGLSAAIPAGQLDRQLSNQNATINWLKSTRGMSDDAAKMIATNPQLLTQMAPMLMGAKPLVPTTLGTDVLGHAIPGMMNSITGEHFDVYGRPLTPGAQGAGGGAPGGVGGVAGGTGIDPAQWAAMAPEDRLAKMDPQIQGEIKAIYEGRQSGSGRNVQQLLPLVNQVYPNFTMQDYNAKKVMQDDLSKSGNSSMGGILANGKSAFAHLAETSDRLADLGNYSSNIPLVGGAAATVGNYVGNVMTPTSDTKAKIAAANDALGHYGQESTKFYAGTGGGVEERSAALKNANPASASGAEQASYLETEKGLMLDRLQQKENQIRGTLEDSYLQQHPVMTPDLQNTLARIDGNIAKLRGQKPAAGQASAPQGGAAAPPQQAAPSVPAPTRFQQLTATGMSKVDAYAQMHQEGY